MTISVILIFLLYTIHLNALRFRTMLHNDPAHGTPGSMREMAASKREVLILSYLKKNVGQLFD